MPKIPYGFAFHNQLHNFISHVMCQLELLTIYYMTNNYLTKLPCGFQSFCMLVHHANNHYGTNTVHVLCIALYYTYVIL